MRIVGTHHVGLVTSNFERLRTFYVETLGLSQVGQFAGRNIIFLDAGPITIELIERDGDAPTAAGAWDHFAFEVADVDATYAELAALGIPFHVLPKDFPEDDPKARIAFFKDPDGNTLELVQPLGERYPS